MSRDSKEYLNICRSFVNVSYFREQPRTIFTLRKLETSLLQFTSCIQSIWIANYLLRKISVLRKVFWNVCEWSINIVAKLFYNVENFDISSLQLTQFSYCVLKELNTLYM